MIKYPRTRHIVGSRLQAGDEDLEVVPFEAVRGRRLVVEEKLDGANAGIRFDAEANMLLQSRGHFLEGGPRERQFDLFKTWAQVHTGALFDVLGDRFVLYGEWLYAKHTVSYDTLPHFFLEFDILDTADGTFLSTERRHAMLAGSPVQSVPVLQVGAFDSLLDLQRLLVTSLYRSAAWEERLRAACEAQGLEWDRTRAETDLTDLAEGLYVKIEEDGRVVERLKFVRPTFLDTLAASGSHWMDRPLVPNRLRDGVDLFASPEPP